MQLCGNDSMYFYAAYVFQEAGIPQDKIPYVVIIMGSCDLIMSVTCVRLLMHSADMPTLLSHLLTCIFLAESISFCAGVTGILPTEVFDQTPWPVAYMICGSLLWFNLFLIGTALPFIVKSLAHFCCVPFLVDCVCTALYIGFFLPETKGKSFLESLEVFKKWNFKAQTHAVFYKGPGEIKPTT
uniref:Uncharacterized protein n=1 Tax=Buteo japonicus TaxID=224669 RepID=A0A8C0BPI0_9AVES